MEPERLKSLGDALLKLCHNSNERVQEREGIFIIIVDILNIKN